MLTYADVLVKLRVMVLCCILWCYIYLWHRHTDTQTHRHTVTQTHTDTHRQTNRHRHTQTCYIIWVGYTYLWPPVAASFLVLTLVIVYTRTMGAKDKYKATYTSSCCDSVHRHTEMLYYL